MARQVRPSDIPVGYVKQYYGVHLRTRFNPAYPDGHCMTLTKCDKCGEWYEASAEHICKQMNSYPEGEFSKRDCSECDYYSECNKKNSAKYLAMECQFYKRMDDIDEQT